MRARNFRRHSGSHYSFSERDADGTEATVILDAAFNRIDSASLAGDLAPEHTGGHGFFITETGNYLLMSYYPAERDLSAFKCRDQDGSTRQCSTMEPADDSVIQEVTPEGNEAFLWNSWDHVTATSAGSLLMFDNGNHCLGPRNARPPVTRIVEYDISTGTEARFLREYRLPAVDGFAASGGGVTALENGNWWITWGNNGPRIAVSEVDTEG